MLADGLMPTQLDGAMPKGGRNVDEYMLDGAMLKGGGGELGVMLVDGEHMVLTRERYETMLDGALSSKGGGEKLEGAMLDEPIHTRGDELDGAMPRGERYA